MKDKLFFGVNQDAVIEEDSCKAVPREVVDFLMERLDVFFLVGENEFGDVGAAAASKHKLTAEQIMCLWGSMNKSIIELAERMGYDIEEDMALHVLSEEEIN